LLRVDDNSSDAMSPLGSANISNPPPQRAREQIQSDASDTVRQRASASDIAIEIMPAG
jgi:hypothetical protein